MFERRKAKRAVLDFANSYERDHCALLGVPFAGGFKSFRELENYVFALVEPSVHGKLLKQMILEIHKHSLTHGPPPVNE